MELIFSALAHEQRRQILLALHLRGGRVKAGDVAARFACSWPTTTRHLKVLEAAGLVSVEHEGRERFYSLDGEALERVVGGWLRHFQPKPKPPKRAHNATKRRAR